jgi:hypothetical protein
MQDRPTTTELADAVRGFLESEVLPALQDPRLRFRALVAVNALGILRRDLEIGAQLAGQEVELLESLLGMHTAGNLQERAQALNAELSKRIRRGEPPSGTLEVLRRIADLKLKISSPRYLTR